MANLLGKRIKEIREQLGMSQKDICKQICSQSYISRIENGDILPSADVLLKLSDRLSINISYLLDISNTPRHDYVIEFYSLIREAVYKRDYEYIELLLSAERNNKLFQDVKHQQFFLWHDGIVQFHLYHNPEQAVGFFDEALSLTSPYKKLHSEREIEILISKGIVLVESGHEDKAMATFKEAVTHFESHPFITNHYVGIRLYYNYGRFLRLQGDYDHSISYCEKGLSICKKNNLLYLKGDLLYQKAYSHMQLKHDELAKNSFQLAEMVYQLEENEKALKMVQKKLETITSPS